MESGTKWAWKVEMARQVTFFSDSSQAGAERLGATKLGFFMGFCCSSWQMHIREGKAALGHLPPGVRTVAALRSLTCLCRGLKGRLWHTRALQEKPRHVMVPTPSLS